MTVPVTTRITIGRTLFGLERTMSFYVPSNFQVNTPIPTNPSVRIEQRQAMTVYVRYFKNIDLVKLGNYYALLKSFYIYYEC